MPFEVEHDWQASLATPKPRIGESAKTRLLLLLCFLWIGLGLIGHTPWKPDEAQTVSAVKHLAHGGDWVVPSIAGSPNLEYPPLYYVTAAFGAKLLAPWLALHDAARLTSGLWMAVVLLMVGMAGRELWGKGSGRQTTFIFLGSLGLLIPAHLLTPEVAGLAGYATAFYGLALAQRRPAMAGLALGTGIGMAFLASGLQAAAILSVTALLLPAIFANWRSRSYLATLLLALSAASPWLTIWPLMLWQQSPELMQSWFPGIDFPNSTNLAYFAKTLTWFAWPALPLAAWGLWHFRKKLLEQRQFQLALAFLAVALLLLGFGSESRDIYALPLLLPLAAIAGGSIESLRRGAASALNWFGLMLFGLLGFLIWLGWFAMMSGFPQKLAARMQKLSAAYESSFSWPVFLAALMITLIWLAVVIRAKRSNRAAVTDWAMGITMVWGLLMTLWLPWIDSAKGYQGVFSRLQQALPADYACVTSRQVGESQRALLDYYANVQTQPFETVQQLNCDLYLIQDEKKREKIEPGPDWKLIWAGRRPSDRRESFRLYQRIDG